MKNTLHARLKVIKLLFAVALAVASLSPQSGAVQAEKPISISIRVMNSRNGKPVPHRSVEVWLDKNRDHKRWGTTDDEGVVEVEIPHDTEVIDAYVYDYVDCTFDEKAKPKYFQLSIKVSEIIQTGVQAPNHCSKRKMAAKPGELVLFTRTLTWWERARL